MRRIDPRLLIGVLLVLGGILSLLDVQGIISNGSGIFWGLLWGALGSYFAYIFFRNPDSRWAAFLAFILLGFALSAILPTSLDLYKELVLFTGISLAFSWLYFRDRERWWAIIPAGVLLTLGIVSALDSVNGSETRNIFCFGLGLTFVLVAILPGGSERPWAWIPGAVFLLFGASLGTSLRGPVSYILPVMIIILGGYFVLRFFMNRSL